MRTVLMRTMLGMFAVAALACWTSPPAVAATWRVGVARADITPQEPIWMAGYAARDHASEGVLHPLWAKALAVEDSDGSRAVLVTADLIGFSREMAERICARVQRATGMTRERILLSASHTHSGPVVGDVVDIAHRMDSKQAAVCARYTQTLEDRVVALVEQAVARLAPGTLSYGESKATFGMNRRLLRDGRYVIGPNPDGPVDPAVPVLRVRDEEGRLQAVLFGYACHNTTLSGYELCGDYAGFACIDVEKAHPGATAMFMPGCGGDINPEPRRTVELAEQHGKSLADAVQLALAGELHAVDGPLTVAFGRVDLPLVDPPSKEELQQRLDDSNPYQRRLAVRLLDQLRQHGSIAASYPYPVQVLRFGDDLTMVALAGEVVVDYAQRLRKESAGGRLWITAYANEVFAYVPSERVLSEGGYEAADSMLYYGIHGPFQRGLEDRIVEQVRLLTEQCSPGGVAGKGAR